MQAIISSKPYKQWCKARGIVDFYGYMRRFPLVNYKLTHPKAELNYIKSKKLTLWEKVKAFFNY